MLIDKEYMYVFLFKPCCYHYRHCDVGVYFVVDNDGEGEYLAMVL